MTTADMFGVYWSDGTRLYELHDAFKDTILLRDSATDAITEISSKTFRDSFHVVRPLREAA